MRLWLKVTLIFALVFSASCGQRKPALIVNHSKATYDKNNTSNKEKYRDSVRKSLGEKTVKKPVAGNEVEVVVGDTLHSISRDHHVSVRDLISQNNLTPPYAIKVGDRISIPSAIYHKVSVGETLYSISRLYEMKINQLVEMNDLKEPYSVKVGELIKISKNPNPPVEVAKKIEEKKDTAAVSKPNFVERALDKLNHFSWPIRGQVTSKFGPKQGGLYNDGINIKAKEGSEVKASEDGTVAYVGNELKGYGNLVIIKHSGGWITAYAHLKNSTVKRGEKVAKGGKIGLVGSTGNVDSPQLYFGLRKGRDAVNPEAYLK
ncbi:MAG: M23 family metallopeptidase [Proteobacteria bacterium]|nr:M23 family metallopeptidase [Pseudomonadota bacterium]